MFTNVLFLWLIFSIKDKRDSNGLVEAGTETTIDSEVDDHCCSHNRGVKLKL